MKILHVVEATTAGVGRHVIDLSAAMQQAGHTVVVACPERRAGAQRDTAFVARVTAAGARVEPIRMQRAIRPGRDGQALLALLGLMRRERFDVVHAHSSKAGVLGRLAARLSGVPAVVYTPNAFAFLGDQPFAGVYRRIERLLGRLATDALICVSPSELDLARRQAIAPAARLVLIPNAIVAADFAPTLDRRAARVRLNLDPDRLLIGTIGRLAPQKGVETLVRAVLRLFQEGVAGSLVLAGEGELAGRVQQLAAAAGMPDRVLLLGYRTDAPLILAALDVFVLASRFEGLPYTLMEAMASGRPVVATECAGNQDLVQDGVNGLLAPVGDERALADALQRLLVDDTLRCSLGAAASETARTWGSPAEMADQVMALYQRLLERPGRSR